MKTMRKRRKAHVYLRELLHNNNAHKISTMALCRNSLLRSVSAAAFCSPQQPHHRHLFSFLPEEGSTIRSRVGTVRPLSTFLHSPAASLFESNNKYNYKYRPTGVITMASSDFSTGSTPDLGSNILSSAIPFMWSGLTIFVGLVAVMGGLLYAKQDSLLYYPEIGGIPRRPSQNPRRYRSPAEHQVPFEEHMIRCDDGVRIHSWLMLRSEQDTDAKKVPTIVFFHGNAGNIGLRLPNALQMLQYLDANVLLVEYRGYGDSDDAHVNEAGLKLDAEAALRFIQTHPRVDPNQIFLFGRSLGGSVAFHLAMHAEQKGIPIAGVMVENTFLSIAAMVDTLMPYVAPFKSLILRIGWNSKMIVPHLTTPILYLAGADDQLVPHEHMLELYKQSKSSRLLQMHIIPGGTHNESWLQGGPEYWQKMKEFMQQAILTEPVGNTPIPSQTYAGASMSSSTAYSTPSKTPVDIPLMPKRFLMSGFGGNKGDNEGTPAKKEN